MCLSGSYWILWLRKTLVKDRHRPREAPPESGSFAIWQTELSSEKHYFPSIHCKNCLTRIKTCVFVRWTVTWLLHDCCHWEKSDLLHLIFLIQMCMILQFLFLPIIVLSGNISSWMYFPLVFIFPHIYDQICISCMATKWKEVINNSIYYALYYNGLSMEEG